MRKDEFPIVDKLVKDSINEVLDKIKEDIKALPNANPSYHGYIDVVERDEVFEIIDKYRK